MTKMYFDGRLIIDWSEALGHPCELVTGPKILVPTGSPFSSTKTAALLSNLTFEPSFL